LLDIQAPFSEALGMLEENVRFMILHLAEDDDVAWILLDTHCKYNF
jgi:hypothetical protein